MWDKVKSTWTVCQNKLKKWLDAWIAKIRLAPSPPEAGVSSRIWRLADHYRSASIFIVSLLGIGLVLFFGTALLVKAALTMFLVFVGVGIILFQLPENWRKKVMANIVKYRLGFDTVTTAVGLWAVFGALFGVTTAFTWAFALLGFSAFISALDFFGKSAWGKGFADKHAFSLKKVLKREPEVVTA